MKATELGLLPRKRSAQDIAAYNEMMLEILRSALSVRPEAAPPTDAQNKDDGQAGKARGKASSEGGITNDPGRVGARK